MTQQEGRLQKAVSLGRDTMTLCRELALVLAFGLLLAWPDTVRTVLNRAGIISVFGIQFRQDLDRLAQSTATAHQEIGSIGEELDKLAKQRPTDKDVTALRTRAKKIENTLKDNAVDLKKLSAEVQSK
jgi:hypothetical protein